AEANYFRNSDSFRHDVNRDNGMTGYSADGFNRLHGNVQPNTGTAMNGTQTPNPSAGGMHNNTRMEAAQDIASRLTTLDPVQSCNVMLTDNNAYVAVDTKDGQNLDNAADVKTQIANQVKAMRPNIQNVYVSADPDFRGRMKGYADNLQAGKPVSGFVNEFNTMAQRLFPTNAANGTVPAAPPVTPAQ
ncbi:MAG: yhcN, partial [Paenibacillus sp.]|nr:yhcN [Paenibacillus sp.]